MANATSGNTSLKVRRSTQSGSKALTAAYAAIYTESCSQAFIFASAMIDLTNMQAGDVVDIRVRKKLAVGGSWINVDELSYSGAQPSGHPAAIIGSLLGIYEIEISMRQTAGVLRTITAEFFDAKRVGLE